MRRAIVVLMLALSGCLSFSTDCKVFRGSDGGSCDAGGDGGGTGSDGGHDAGVDGGHVVFADAGSFLFSQVFPEDSGVQGVYDFVTGTSEQDIYVADSLGVLRHYDGTRWNVAYVVDGGVAPVFRGLHENSNLWLYAATADSLITCQDACSPASSVDDYYLGDYTVFTGLCARNDAVYATGVSVVVGLGTTLTHYEVNGWNSTAAGDVVTKVGGCALSANGEVIVGEEAVVGVFEVDGGYHQEDAGYGELQYPNDAWTTLCAAGSEIIATGPGKKISIRDASGRWAPFVDAPAGDFSGLWNGAASSSTGEVILAGTRGPAGTLARLSGGVLYLLPDLPNIELHDVWAESDHVWYFVGRDSNGAGVMFKGTR